MEATAGAMEGVGVPADDEGTSGPLSVAVEVVPSLLGIEISR